MNKTVTLQAVTQTARRAFSTANIDTSNGRQPSRENETQIKETQFEITDTDDI